MVRTTSEEYAALLENQRRVKRKQTVMNHVPSAAEVLALQLREAGVSLLYDSFEFHPARKYRADIAIPALSPWLIVEVDGNGSGSHPGAHRSLAGYERDRERDFEAISLGYTVLRVTPRLVLSGVALQRVLTLVQKAQK